MKKTTNAIVVKKLKELITKKIETLASTYCAYRASLKSYEESPDLFLEEDTTKRTSVLAKEINASMNEINMLLVVLSNQEFMHIESITDLKDFATTKKIKISFVTAITIGAEWRATRLYGFYNATTGEIEYCDSTTETKEK